MKHPDTYRVKLADERPARPDGTCFYCRAVIGAMHKEGCVIRARTVVCEFKVTLVLSVPENWDDSMIESYINNSDWCGDQVFAELEEIRHTEGRFVREATLEDEETYTCVQGGE